jgi:hypothetical protein
MITSQQHQQPKDERDSVHGRLLAYARACRTGVVSRAVTENHKFDPGRIKHMEMIQAVVSRLAGNSFLIKGWALTITGVFLGFALDRDNSDLAVAAFVPILMFWMLDAYYLRSERLFRALYDEVRTGDAWVKPFYMGGTSRKFVKRVREGETSAAKSAASRWRTFWSQTLWPFYLVLLASTVLVIVVICTGSDSPRKPDTLLSRPASLAYSARDIFKIDVR